MAENKSCEGPLEVYRKRATFDWKLLRNNLHGEEAMREKTEVWDLMESSPLFRRDVKSSSLDEQRRSCHARLVTLMTKFPGALRADHKNQTAWMEAVTQYDGSLAVKIYAVSELARTVLSMLGTERHADLIEKLERGTITAAFALTEVSHGSDTKNIRTTATYDRRTETFVLNTPDFESAKCWPAGLGKSTLHLIVWAQLFTPDGKCHGPHAFWIDIRDPETMRALPGVTIGDLGETIGLNGIDNGFLSFANYEIPRTNLLNRMDDVTPDGNYATNVIDPSKRFATSLGVLSVGRIAASGASNAYLTLAVVIAIRYSSVRKQFGPRNSPEMAVIEYQMQQLRIFPHLAASYALRVFQYYFQNYTNEYRMKLRNGDDSEMLAAQGFEIHALSSAIKPLFSWTACAAIQDCRESCGGHGYLKVTRLGDLRNDNDAGCTYEGENNVLLQQTSNWLLNQRTRILNGEPVFCPTGSIDFLFDLDDILGLNFDRLTVEDTVKPENLLKAFEWLVCHYLEKTRIRIEELRADGKDSFSVRNKSQSFRARTLSLVFAEYIVIRVFFKRSRDPVFSIEESRVLSRLCSLYAASCLERRLGDLYAGGYASKESRMEESLRDGIIRLCEELLPEAVALADVIAPPDFVLNSPLGMFDGQVYEHLKEWIYKDEENFEIPSWWKEVVNPKL